MLSLCSAVELIILHTGKWFPSISSCGGMLKILYTYNYAQ